MGTFCYPGLGGKGGSKRWVRIYVNRRCGMDAYCMLRGLRFDEGGSYCRVCRC